MRRVSLERAGRGRGASVAIVLLALALWFTGARAAWAQVNTPDVAARAWALWDMSGEQLLAGKDVDLQVEPASLTKLMTAYLVFDALKSGRLAPEQMVTVSTEAWKAPGSRMFIEPRVPVSVADLLKGMIVQSGNDATTALAEVTAGSVDRFVEQMNRQAKLLGLRDTVFKNPTGLPAPGHLTTARDLITLSHALIRDFPQEFKLYSQRQFTYNGITQDNRNALLARDPSVDGLKTGFTESAGYCLVATAHKPAPNFGDDGFPKGERRLISVVLGTASHEARAQESQKLLNWGYAQFDAVKLFDARAVVEQPRVWKGQANQVKLGALKPLYVAVPKGTAARLKTSVVRAEPLLAPIERGQAVAKLKVELDGQPVTEVPLVALDGVARAGLLGRAWDQLRLLLK